MAENLTPKKYIDSSNMKQILAAIKDKTPVGDKYVTEEQLLAKDYATKTYVGEQIVNAEHLKREIVTVLPSDTEASDNIIYMLKVESATGNDKYQEYMKIDGTVQMIGDTSVDLTDYAKTSDIPTTVAELTDSSSYAKKTDIPTTLPANGGNADTVNNHTVKSDVPENAKFTDTIYDDTELNAKLNGKADKNAVLNSLEIVNGYTTAQIIPWNDGTHYRSFEDTSNNTYTDIVTNNGIAIIVRTENDVMTKSAEIATMDKVAKYPDWSNQLKINQTEITVDQDVYIELNQLSTNPTEDLKINGKVVSVSDFSNGFYSMKFSGYVKKGSVVSYPYLDHEKFVKVFPLV